MEIPYEQVVHVLPIFLLSGENHELLLGKKDLRDNDYVLREVKHS